MTNKDYQRLDEDMKFEALSQLREIQSNLVAVSFLPVIGIMKPENPLKKDVLKFQDELDELTMKIQSFISSAKNDVAYDEGGDADGTDDSEPEEKEGDEPEEKPEVEDSSEPKE
jgi:hypothetical protein